VVVAFDLESQVEAVLKLVEKYADAPASRPTRSSCA
jgi:hypothetical protein